MIIRDCQTAVEVQATNPFGMEFAKCTFEGREYGFRLGSRFSAAILLNDCDLSAEQALYSEGSGCFIAQNSRITRGNIALTGGVLALTACKIQDVKAADFTGQKCAGLRWWAIRLPTRSIANWRPRSRVNWLPGSCL